MTQQKIKVKRKSKLYEYMKTERFAVVRKLEKNRRYYCNFRMIYDDKTAAETEALRLANEAGGQFYVIEIQGITTDGFKRKTAAPKAEIQ